jgi:hypothetical protein
MIRIEAPSSPTASIADYRGHPVPAGLDATETGKKIIFGLEKLRVWGIISTLTVQTVYE